MTSKMAPAQQSLSLSFSPDFCFVFFSLSFSSFCFETSCHTTFEDFGDFGKFVFVRRFGAAVSFIFVSVLIS